MTSATLALTRQELLALRLTCQGLTDPFPTLEAAAQAFGVTQGQQFPQCLDSLLLRTVDAGREDAQEALNAGKLARAPGVSVAPSFSPHRRTRPW